MSSTGRLRDHLTLLAISLALCAVLALSGCGSSSSSHSTSANAGTPAASSTTSGKSAVKHSKSSHTTTSAAAQAQQPASTTPVPPSRRKLAQAVKKFRSDPVGASFSVAAGIFKRFVYGPVIHNPGQNAMQRRFARMRASAALVFVGHSLTAASLQSKRSSSLSSFSPRFTGLSSQALGLRSAFTKGQKPIAGIQSFMQSLRSTASSLQAHGVHLFLPSSF